jgi:hypothetical protein
MMKSFTLNHLISHSFEEIEAEAQVSLTHGNPVILPANELINRILGYSRALKMHPSASVGYISYLMN